jgi:hypothetical protein
MSSTSETGHAKNVANFQGLTEVVKTMPKYKPNSERFTIPGLEAKYQLSLNSTNALIQADIAWGNLITERQNLFAPLPELATRIFNGLADTEASDGFKKDVATIVRKIHGKRATPKKKSGDAQADSKEPDPKTISTSQLSFDNMVEHYRKLVELLSTEPTYKLADEAISLPGLQAMLAKMETINKAVKAAEAAFGEHLRLRNEMLYEEKTGLCDIATEVKKLVRSAYGSRSPEARAVAAFQFKRYAKNKV